MTHSILNFGAKSGAASSASSIQAALDAVRNNGGGEVIIPPGLWYSGTLNLSSNLVLRVQAGAILKASPNFSEFTPAPDLAAGYHSLVRAEEAENSLITGGGTIDGNIRAWTRGFDQTPRYTWTDLKPDRPTPLHDFAGHLSGKL